MTASPGSAPLWTRCVQVPEVGLQVLPVGIPRHPVHPRRSLRADRPVGRSEAVLVDMVQQRGEPCILVPSCYFTHTIQPARPGTASGTCFAVRVPLGQPPFLHRLRRRTVALVRRLHRYYGPVRLPPSFISGVPPQRSRAARPAISAAGEHGIPGSRAWRFRTCNGSPTARGPPTARVYGAAADVAFRSFGQRRHPETLISRLNSPACTYPCQRFAAALAGAHAWLRAIVVRYSFDVGLFHPISMPVYPGAPERRSRASGNV